MPLDDKHNGSADQAFDGEEGNFLDQTMRVWQPYADRKLTREDAREIDNQEGRSDTQQRSLRQASVRIMKSRIAGYLPAS
ncbi:hypothetical protein Q2941_26235 [Bradyrhizobium sp. UFLA05-153]